MLPQAPNGFRRAAPSLVAIIHLLFFLLPHCKWPNFSGLSKKRFWVCKACMDSLGCSSPLRQVAFAAVRSLALAPLAGEGNQPAPLGWLVARLAERSSSFTFFEALRFCFPPVRTLLANGGLWHAHHPNFRTSDNPSDYQVTRRFPEWFPLAAWRHWIACRRLKEAEELQRQAGRVPREWT